MGVLDQSIVEVMDLLPIHKEIKTALVEKNNDLASYLSLSLALEQGLWQQAKQQSAALGIDEKDCLNAYQESIVWSDAMLAVTC